MKKKLCSTELFKSVKKFLFYGVLVSTLVFAACGGGNDSRQYYSVAFKVDGGHGTLTAEIGGSKRGKSPLSGLSVGTKITFTATPESGYEVESWILNGKRQSSVDKVYTLTVSAHNTVTVKFKQIPVEPKKPDTPKPENPPQKTPSEYKVTIQPAEHGRVTANPPLPASGMVKAGTVITFTAEPDENYKIKEWIVTGGKVTSGGMAESKTATITITAATTVSARFIQKTAPVTKYVVSFSADTSKGGALLAKGPKETISSGASVISGTELTFTASPNAGYTLKNWMLNGKAVSGTDLTYTVRITEKTTVTAVFAALYRVTLKTAEHGILTVSPELKDGKAIEGTELTFTAKADQGYKVTDWNTDGSFIEGTGKAGQETAKVKVTTDVTVGVTFAPQTFQVTYGVESSASDLTLRAEYKGGASVATSPAIVEYGKTLVFIAEHDPSIKDKVVDWSIQGSQAQEGGTRGKPTAIVTVKEATKVTVRWVPVSVQELLNLLKTVPPQEVHEDFSLATELAGNPITWESSNLNAVRVEGNKAVVTQDLAAQTVMLTAKLTRGEETATRTFKVTVQSLRTQKIEMPASDSEKRNFTFENETLEVMRGEGNAKAGSRYKVESVDAASKTLTARLIAEYTNNRWNIFAEAEQNDKKELKHYIQPMQQLAAKDTLNIDIVKEAFGQKDQDAKTYFEENKRLFGGDQQKSFWEFQYVSQEEQTAIIKDSLEQNRKSLCREENLPEQTTWETILQKVMEKIEKRFAFRARSGLYSYTLTKKEKNQYTIAVESKYDAKIDWYKQQGRYVSGSNDLILSIEDSQPPLMVKIDYSGKTYSSPLIEGGNSFTAQAEVGLPSVNVTITDPKTDGSLNITINSSQYPLKFEPIKMK